MRVTEIAKIDGATVTREIELNTTQTAEYDAAGELIAQRAQEGGVVGVRRHSDLRTIAGLFFAEFENAAAHADGDCTWLVANIHQRRAFVVAFAFRQKLYSDPDVASRLGPPIEDEFVPSVSHVGHRHAVQRCARGFMMWSTLFPRDQWLRWVEGEEWEQYAMRHHPDYWASQLKKTPPQPPAGDGALTESGDAKVGVHRDPAHTASESLVLPSTRSRRQKAGEVKEELDLVVLRLIESRAAHRALEASADAISQVQADTAIATVMNELEPLFEASQSPALSTSTISILAKEVAAVKIELDALTASPGVRV